MSSTTAVDARPVHLCEVEELVGVWCELVDPALLTADQAAEVVERLAVVGRRVAAKQAAVAARVAECRVCPGRSSSPEEYLAIDTWASLPAVQAGQIGKWRAELPDSR